MFSRHALRTSHVFLEFFKLVVRRVARCYCFSALRSVVACAAWLVLSEFLQPTARVMVVFVGSHRAWWRHLRLKCDVFQARGVPSAPISECFQ